MTVEAAAINHQFVEQALPLWGQLYRQAYAWTGCREDAEDAVQDTYVKAYAAFGRYQEGNLPAWLAQILRNVLVTSWRKKRPEPIDPTDLVGHRPAWGQPAVAVEQEVIEQLDLSPVGAALATLTPAHRACLIAASMYGESNGTMYADLAVMFEISPGTVGSRLRRARLHARSALAEMGVS